MVVKPRTPKAKEPKVEEPKEIKTSDGINLLGTSRLKIYYRDVAGQWPCSDANAENPLIVEQDISAYRDDGWVIEAVEVYPRRGVGDMVNEFVLPMLFVLSR